MHDFLQLVGVLNDPNDIIQTKACFKLLCAIKVSLLLAELWDNLLSQFKRAVPIYTLPQL